MQVLNDFEAVSELRVHLRKSRAFCYKMVLAS